MPAGRQGGKSSSFYKESQQKLQLAAVCKSWGFYLLQLHSRPSSLDLGTTLFLASQLSFQGPGPGRILPALFLSSGTSGCSLGGLPPFQDLNQSAKRDLAIDKLGPRIPGRYPDTGDSVQQCGCCLDFVNVLTTRAAGACKNLFKVLRLQAKPVNPLQQRRVPYNHAPNLCTFAPNCRAPLERKL